MYYDIQRASMTRRIPAWILDFILLITLVTGFMWAWSFVFDNTAYTQQIVAIENQYRAEYDGDLKVSLKEYEAMTDEERTEKLTAEEKKQIEEAIVSINQALSQNKEYSAAYGKWVSNMFSIISLSFLCAYAILEFLIPLWLKNGQTLGKKCFGVALMRKDGIKVTPFMVFTRTILGKCSLELMVPVMLYVMLSGSIVGLGVAAVFLLAQVIVPMATYNKTAIHDLVACTVAVDLSSQMIFDSPEAQTEYYKRLHEENPAQGSAD